MRNDWGFQLYCTSILPLPNSEFSDFSESAKESRLIIDYLSLAKIIGWEQSVGQLHFIHSITSCHRWNVPRFDVCLARLIGLWTSIGRLQSNWINKLPYFIFFILLFLYFFSNGDILIRKVLKKLWTQDWASTMKSGRGVVVWAEKYIF